MESHANGPQFFLLPAVLGAFESARKLLRAGDRFGYELCAAFRALHRGRTFASKCFPVKFELFARGILAEYQWTNSRITGQASSAGHKWILGSFAWPECIAHLGSSK